MRNRVATEASARTAPSPDISARTTNRHTLAVGSTKISEFQNHNRENHPHTKPPHWRRNLGICPDRRFLKLSADRDTGTSRSRRDQSRTSSADASAGAGIAPARKRALYFGESQVARHAPRPADNGR